jgi:VIT1/CCC1 family predicted Fe2+/Mn2+ transporter
MAMSFPALTLFDRTATAPSRADLAGRLNRLRAGVLGANDGIVSVAAIVVGVAGVTSQSAPIIASGVAGLIGGAISMGLGEYVSVSSQRDSQRALIERERTALSAAAVTVDDDEVASPWQAAWASAAAFTLGAILPLLAIILTPAEVRIPLTFVVVLVALGLTGAAGARIGGSPATRATVRVVVGGALALAATFAIGSLLGTTGIL